MEKEIDGQTWILKSRVEEIIQGRISKVAQRASTAEDTIKELQGKLEEASKSQGSLDIMTNRIQELQGELDKANTRYTRYQAITKHGLKGEDMLEAIEYAYERSQAKLPQEQQADLNTWLDNMVKNPADAPFLIRPHLQGLQANTAQPQEASQPSQPAQLQEASTPAQLQELGKTQPPPQPPRVNMGVQRSPEPTDILDRAINDPEFLRQNRDRVMQAWRVAAGRNK